MNATDDDRRGVPEKSDAGFPVVNPAYGDRRSHWTAHKRSLFISLVG
ncbi:MAG: hypothetical protein LDL41_04905 [Coleofasciculus sp. S288]|nr:hypothetical protein [Coleofasciculus sp. S288]